MLLVLLTAGMIMGLAADRRPTSGAAGSSLAGGPAGRFDGATLRVAAFNIHAGRTIDGQPSLERSAALLEGFELIGLNEVRGRSLWHRDDQAARLGQRLAMNWLFAPSERRWFSDYWGNALLASVPLDAWQVVPLAGTRGKAYRNVIHAQLEFCGRPLEVLVTHIDTSADHDHQLSAVADRFLHLAEPVILMGDLNTRRSNPKLAEVLATPGVVDCVGAIIGPADWPERIDWILARGLAVDEAGFLDEGSSDHPCVWARLRLEAPAGP